MLKHKKPLKITSRISSVTNGFVQAVLPDAVPPLEQQQALFARFGIDPANSECVYCGGKATDWDHLRALVKAKKPTGHLTDYTNLVPACGPCNQSKSGSAWRDWMNGASKGSPKSRGVNDLQARIDRLDLFETEVAATMIDFLKIVGAEVWERYWIKMTEIERLMRDAQQQAEIIRSNIKVALGHHVPPSAAPSEPMTTTRASIIDANGICGYISALLLDDGLDYDEIRCRIKARFPTARTTNKSIASIAAGMRRKGIAVAMRNRIP